MNLPAGLMSSFDRISSTELEDTGGMGAGRGRESSVGAG